METVYNESTHSVTGTRRRRKSSEISVPLEQLKFEASSYTATIQDISAYFQANRGYEKAGEPIDKAFALPKITIGAGNKLMVDLGKSQKLKTFLEKVGLDQDFLVNEYEILTVIAQLRKLSLKDENNKQQIQILINSLIIVNSLQKLVTGGQTISSVNTNFFQMAIDNIGDRINVAGMLLFANFVFRLTSHDQCKSFVTSAILNDTFSGNQQTVTLFKIPRTESGNVTFLLHDLPKETLTSLAPQIQSAIAGRFAHTESFTPGSEFASAITSTVQAFGGNYVQAKQALNEEVRVLESLQKDEKVNPYLRLLTANVGKQFSEVANGEIVTSEIGSVLQRLKEDETTQADDSEDFQDVVSFDEEIKFAQNEISKQVEQESRQEVHYPKPITPPATSPQLSRPPVVSSTRGAPLPNPSESSSSLPAPSTSKPTLAGLVPSSLVPPASSSAVSLSETSERLASVAEDSLLSQEEELEEIDPLEKAIREFKWEWPDLENLFSLDDKLVIQHITLDDLTPNSVITFFKVLLEKVPIDGEAEAVNSSIDNFYTLIMQQFIKGGVIDHIWDIITEPFSSDDFTLQYFARIIAQGFITLRSSESQYEDIVNAINYQIEALNIQKGRIARQDFSKEEEQNLMKMYQDLIKFYNLLDSVLSQEDIGIDPSDKPQIQINKCLEFIRQIETKIQRETDRKFLNHDQQVFLDLREVLHKEFYGEDGTRDPQTFDVKKVCTAIEKAINAYMFIGVPYASEIKIDRTALAKGELRFVKTAVFGEDERLIKLQKLFGKAFTFSKTGFTREKRLSLKTTAGTGTEIAGDLSNQILQQFKQLVDTIIEEAKKPQVSASLEGLGDEVS